MRNRSAEILELELLRLDHRSGLGLNRDLPWAMHAGKGHGNAVKRISGSTNRNNVLQGSQTMHASDVMNTQFITLKPDNTIAKAVERF